MFIPKKVFIFILLAWTILYQDQHLMAAIADIEYFFNDPSVPEGEGISVGRVKQENGLFDNQ